jgi:hypothetical protein
LGSTVPRSPPRAFLALELFSVVVDVVVVVDLVVDVDGDGFTIRHIFGKSNRKAGRKEGFLKFSYPNLLIFPLPVKKIQRRTRSDQ